MATNLTSSHLAHTFYYDHEFCFNDLSHALVCVIHSLLGYCFCFPREYTSYGPIHQTPNNQDLSDSDTLGYSRIVDSLFAMALGEPRGLAQPGR